MTWTYVNQFLKRNSKVTGTTWAPITGAVVQVGEVCRLFIALDNLSTTDGNTNDVISVTDTFGNVWRKLFERTNSNAAAGAGVTIAAFYSYITTQIPSGSALTFTFSASVAAKAAYGARYTIGAGNKVSVAGMTVNTGDAVDPAAQSLVDLNSGEYLFVHSMAHEGPIEDGWTGTTNYAAGYNTAGTTGGVADTNVSLVDEERIFTGTGDNVDIASTVDRDYVQVYIALREAPSTVTASAGSVVISGTEATLRHTYNLSAVSGSVSITGTAATLEEKHKIPANAGSVLITGQAAILSKSGNVLIADAGSYLIAGTDVNLLVKYKVFATFDAFSISGTPATLIYTSTPHSVPGVYATWPSTLPALPLFNDYGEAAPDVAFQSDFEGGQIIRRRRTTASPRILDFPLSLTRVQTALLDLFYEDDLRNVLPFYVTHPRTKATILCRFASTFTYDVMSWNTYRANLKLEILG